jgi:hypothetical protein
MHFEWLFALAACAGSAAEPPRVSPHGPAAYFVSLELESGMLETGNHFYLVYASLSLDGEPVAEAGVRDGFDELGTPRCLYRGRVQAGTHDLALELRFRGRGSGVFVYLRGYLFDARSTTRLDVRERSFGVAVTATGYEGGTVTTPLEDRPRIRWRTEEHTDGPTAGCDPQVPN